MTKKKKSGWKSFVLILSVLLVFCSGLSLISSFSSKKKTYIEEAAEYSNLQKFSYFADKDGKKVSEENPYKYTAESKKELTAVYEDFLDVKVKTNTTETAAYYAETKTFRSGSWYDMGYVTEPLKYGMTVSFDLCPSGQIVFGLSDIERVENPTSYGWGTGFPSLFTPENNFYWSVSEDSFLHLVQSTTSHMGTKVAVSDSSVAFWGTSEEHSVKIVFADKMQLYLDDVLLSGSLPDWTLDKNAEYYLSLGGYSDFVFTEFCYDKDSSMKTYYLGATEASFEGKTITFLGDSITAGVGVNTTSERYSTLLCAALNATENNMGISGTVICTGHASRRSRIQDVAGISEDSDYVMVLLGTNDFDVATTGFAEMGTKGTSDTTTVYGAVQALCDELNKKFADMDTLCYLVTPIFQRGDVEGTVACDNGYTMRDFCEVLLELAEENNIMVYDLNKYSGLTVDDVPDGLHPNASGTAKMAKKLKDLLLKGKKSQYVPVR